MSITITISTNRQIKTSDGGSIGATAGMTVELVTPASATDAELQREIRHHYETVTGAMTDQLRHLAAPRTNPTPAPTPPAAVGNGSANGPANGTPKTPASPPPANGNGRTTPAGNSAPAPAKAPAATSAKPNGTPTVQAEPPKPTPQATSTTTTTPNPDPTTGPDLDQWADTQADAAMARHNLEVIGRECGYPTQLKYWSPTMVKKGLNTYHQIKNQKPTNGNTKATTPPPATKATPPTIPIQPARARAQLDLELRAQFAARASQENPDADVDDIDDTDADDLQSETDPDENLPATGRGLLDWCIARGPQTKQEIALIGRHKRHPALIKDWTPTQVAQALEVYYRTSPV